MAFMLECGSNIGYKSEFCISAWGITVASMTVFLCPPIARDIAVPDEEIPPEYWRYDKVTLLPYRPPKPGHIHKVGEKTETGVDTQRYRSGVSSNPTRVDSFDGMFTGLV